MLAKCVKCQPNNTRSSRVSGVCQSCCTSGAGSPVTSLLSSPGFLWNVPTRHIPFLCTVHLMIDKTNNKQADMQQMTLSKKHRRNWGFVLCFWSPLGSSVALLEWQILVGANLGHRCVRMLSISLGPSSFTARRFSKCCVVCESSLTFPATDW